MEEDIIFSWNKITVLSLSAVLHTPTSQRVGAGKSATKHEIDFQIMNQRNVSLKELLDLSPDTQVRLRSIVDDGVSSEGSF